TKAVLEKRYRLPRAIPKQNSQITSSALPGLRLGIPSNRQKVLPTDANTSAAPVLIPCLRKTTSVHDRQVASMRTPKMITAIQVDSVPRTSPLSRRGNRTRFTDRKKVILKPTITTAGSKM